MGGALGVRCGCPEQMELSKAWAEQGECTMAEVGLDGWGETT